MFIPSSVIRDRVMTPAIEARAENLRQRRLIFNPTVDADSLVEHVKELGRTASPAQREHVRAILEFARQILESNEREGELARQIAGLGDSLARDLRRCESVRGADGCFSVKEISRRLRKPLEVVTYAKRHDSKKFLAASRELRELFDLVPAVWLLDNVSLRHELGVRLYTTLTDLVQDVDA